MCKNAICGIKGGKEGNQFEERKSGWGEMKF
jgi:hypothetical protein